MTDSVERHAQAELSLMDLSFSVNGTPRTVRVHPMERLLDTVRQELGLTGTKEGCGEGECGSCSVLMDGALVNSCLVPVLQAKDADIVTIEGLAADGKLNDIQEAFLQYGGAQCGICTPGMILAASHLLRTKPEPTMEDIRDGLSGTLCRCTGYMQIFEAVAEAARRRGNGAL
jgi:carbon-monoxide dehydrogenase small subunit